MRTPPHPGGTAGTGPPPLSPHPLAEWISIDKDETAAGKGKVPLGARANQDYAKYGGLGLVGRGRTSGPWLGVLGAPGGLNHAPVLQEHRHLSEHPSGMAYVTWLGTVPVLALMPRGLGMRGLSASESGAGPILGV